MLKSKLTYVLAVLTFVGNAEAQTFSAESLSRPQQAAAAAVPAGRVEKPVTDDAAVKDETLEQINKAFAATQEKIKAPAKNDDPLSQISKALEASGQKAEGAAAAEAVAATQKEEDVFIPEGELYRLNTPTLDGSVRGGQAFVEVDDKGRMKKVDNIFLFYDNFKVTNYLSNTASCDVRFNILSNLDQKISKLDIKLVWPEMTTTLSFANIQPNTQTYYNYSLLGNGCYNMDKAPNIIVNRCRVKGMTASECANKLVWLTK